MAERKTKYTNADLVPERPRFTTRIEQAPRRSSDPVDMLVESGTSVDDLLAGAKAALRRSQPLQALLNDVSRQQHDDEAAVAQARAANPVRNFVQGVRESPVSQGAMALGSIVPSPIQPGMAALLALDAGAQFAEDPSVMNAAGAGLMAVPGLAAGSRALKAGKAAKEGKRVAEGLYRQTGMSRGREVPYRMGGATQANRPSMVSLADDVPEYSVLDDAAPLSVGVLPKGPSTLAEGLRNAPTSKRVAGEVLSSHGKAGQFNGRSYDMSMAGDAQTAAKNSKARAFMNRGKKGVMQPVAAHGKPPEFVHAVDTSGGKFGFEHLPEISEGELLRLQNLFQRVSGR